MQCRCHFIDLISKGLQLWTFKDFSALSLSGNLSKIINNSIAFGMKQVFLCIVFYARVYLSILLEIRFCICPSVAYIESVEYIEIGFFYSYMHAIKSSNYLNHMVGVLRILLGGTIKI